MQRKRLLRSRGLEGELQNNTTPAAPAPTQAIDLDISTPPPQQNPLRPTTYEYQSLPTPTPSSPSKRASEAKVAESFQSFKRLRVTDDSTPEPSRAPSPPATPVRVERPPVERNSSLRFDKPSKTQYRSRSLPATLRRKRRSGDSNAQLPGGRFWGPT